MKPLRLILFTALLLGILSACGQKGPLYLPGTDGAPASTAPAEEKEDSDEA